MPGRKDLTYVGSKGLKGRGPRYGTELILEIPLATTSMWVGER